MLTVGGTIPSAGNLKLHKNREGELGTLMHTLLLSSLFSIVETSLQAAASFLPP